jgi:hypothetical protein
VHFEHDSNDVHLGFVHHNILGISTSLWAKRSRLMPQPIDVEHALPVIDEHPTGSRLQAR